MGAADRLPFAKERKNRKMKKETYVPDDGGVVGPARA